MGDTSPATVISFGEVLWDLLPDGRLLGGAPANLAYRLTSLGTPTFLVSRVGKDPLGREIIEQMKARGVETSFIQQDPQKPTGTVPIILSASGDAEFTILPEVAYDYIEFTPELEEVAMTSKAICFGLVSQRSKTSRETLGKLLAASEGAIRVLDLNLRKDCYSEETVRRSLNFADVLKLNKQEVAVLAPMLNLPVDDILGFADAILQHYELETVLITLGREGFYCFSRDGKRLKFPGYTVRVADTVGSGDSFTAAFLHRRLAGASLEEACRFANQVGAASAKKKGGMPTLTAEEISSLGEVTLSVVSR